LKVKVEKIRLSRGKHSQVDCLGSHLPVNFNRRVCPCGATGCAETEGSTPSLPGASRCTSGYESSALVLDESVTAGSAECPVGPPSDI
jgi:predicted NBD/HSP70 family sugar kinase